jgi:hypothetical protein
VGSTGEIATGLVSLVRARAQSAALAWFESALSALDAAGQRGHFLSVFAAAGRRLGREGVVLDGTESQLLETAGLSPFPIGLGLDECGRGALALLALQDLPLAECLDLASDLYHRGEVRERQALLRVLAYLPSPASFRELGVEACRTSTQSVFEAIACENPFAAAHFAEPSFNQMVLKAVFNGVALHRIAGLAKRVTPDLVRMAEDYAAERRAAGRSLPDMDLILSAGTRSA